MTLAEGTTLEKESSIVDVVDAIIFRAVHYSASDIHFEPSQDGLCIRFRIDGILYDQEKIPSVYALQIVSRIKILAQCDIAEKRIPQDGKMAMTFPDKNIDLRVSTFPS